MPSDTKVETQCVSFTLPQQFSPKYKQPPANHNEEEEDVLRTCEFNLYILPVEITVLFFQLYASGIYYGVDIALRLWAALPFA